MNTEFRQHMIELLGTIASPSMQEAYKNVPIANVPDELICQWLDDFHPETELFKDSFSNDEINELIKFTKFYDARVEAIPNDGGVAKLQANGKWFEVQSMANDTLKICGCKHAL